MKEIEITDIKPCWTEPGKGRIFVEARTKQKGEKPLEDIIPVLFLKYPAGGTLYNYQKNALTLRLHNRGVGIFPSGTITMQNTKDEEEAKGILEEIRGDLNEAYAYLIEKGRPSEDLIRKKKDVCKLSPFDIKKYFPNIADCNECGEANCLAFAFKLLSGELELKDCVMLKEKKYHPRREKLERMLGVGLIDEL